MLLRSRRAGPVCRRSRDRSARRGDSRGRPSRADSASCATIIDDSVTPPARPPRRPAHGAPRPPRIVRVAKSCVPGKRRGSGDNAKTARDAPQCGARRRRSASSECHVRSTDSSRDRPGHVLYRTGRSRYRTGNHRWTPGGKTSMRRRTRVGSVLFWGSVSLGLMLAGPAAQADGDLSRVQHI